MEIDFRGGRRAFSFQNRPACPGLNENCCAGLCVTKPGWKEQGKGSPPDGGPHGQPLSCPPSRLSL